jgi:hypothetical protein
MQALPGMVPPKIIIFYGIIRPDLIINPDLRRQTQLIPATPVQAVTGHHPPHKEAVFVERLDTVSGTGGIHGTLLTVDGGYVGSVRFDHKPQRIRGGMPLFLRAISRPLFSPGAFKGISAGVSRTPQKDYQKDTSNAHLRRQENNILAFFAFQRFSHMYEYILDFITKRINIVQKC